MVMLAEDRPGQVEGTIERFRGVVGEGTVHRYVIETYALLSQHATAIGGCQTSQNCRKVEH